jgi:hypothetical protein
MKIEQMFLM